MSGWLGDLGRLTWGLLYWNLRKALFRMRGAAGRAPCQHPSDSGLACQTGCEAYPGWRSPGAFRLMCPLLVTTPSGRRVCSVAAADVRPFWGRAAAFYLGTSAAVFAAAVLAAFSVFRGVGYRVPLYVVAWPPAWHRIQQARADYYYRMALSAYGSGDVRQSYLALSKVYAMDPGNQGASRLLAQFTQIANPEFSDEIYWRLLRTPGADRNETAQAWFRALLSRGDFAGLSRLSSVMLSARGADAPAWTQGLLFSAEMGLGYGGIDAVLSKGAAIPDEGRSVLELSRTLRDAAPGSAAAAIEAYLGSASTPFEAYYGLRQLLRLGRAAEVISLLGGQVGATLGTYEREAVKLDAYAALGWRDLENSEIGLLLARGSSPVPVALVAAHLVRYPSPSASSFFFGLLAADPLPETTAAIGTHMAALCAAGANGLDAPMKAEIRALSKIVGGTFASATRVSDFFQSRDPSRRPSTFLPALAQLPLEVEYALFERFGSPAPQQPGAGGGKAGD